MKKNVIVGLFISMSIFLGTGTLLAEENSPKPDSSLSAPPISKEDAAKLKGLLDQFNKVESGEKPPAPSTSSTPEKKEESKTMANVADRALDMLGSVVAGISQSLQKIAPEVWRIMIKQQFAKAAFNVATPLLFFLGGLIGIVIMRKMWKAGEGPLIDQLPKEVRYTGWDKGDGMILKQIFRSWIPLAFLVISGGILAINIGESIKLVINPEFYAIKDLITLVSDPKSLE